MIAVLPSQATVALCSVRCHRLSTDSATPPKASGAEAE